MTPGERRLDELVCALAASQPVLHDFARARVAAKLRREIEELEAREAEEYGERAAARCEEIDAAHSERLAEIWSALDDGEPGPERIDEPDDEPGPERVDEPNDAAARDAGPRESSRGERARARRQRARWVALAGSAAALGAMMGLLHDLQGEEERPMLVSVAPVQTARAAPASAPTVPGKPLASMEQGLVAAIATRKPARAAIARGWEQRAKQSTASPFAEIDAATKAALAGAHEQHQGAGLGVPLSGSDAGEQRAAQLRELRGSGIVTELAGISARAAAAAALPRPADEIAEYLRCEADRANGLPGALRCLASFRARFPISVYDADALATLALFTAEAERCGEALPLLDEYLARYADRARAPLIRRQRGQCGARVLVQRRREPRDDRSVTLTERD